MKALGLRFVMLTVAITSVAMTWGIVLVSHRLAAYRIFEALGPAWKGTAWALAVCVIPLAAVSLLRRDFGAGLIAFACSLSVLSAAWIKGLPVP